MFDQFYTFCMEQKLQKMFVYVVHFEKKILVVPFYSHTLKLNEGRKISSNFGDMVLNLLAVNVYTRVKVLDKSSDH